MRLVEVEKDVEEQERQVRSLLSCYTFHRRRPLTSDHFANLIKFFFRTSFMLNFAFKDQSRSDCFAEPLLLLLTLQSGEFSEF